MPSTSQLTSCLPLNRRGWLKVTSIGWLSTALGAPLGRVASAGQSPSAGRLRPIKSCIVVFHYGGPSQFETYDPKPHAPQGIRGEYGTISTAVPGITIGEYLPRCARIMDRLTVVRSMHHPMRNHNSAAAEVFTGRTPAGGDLELLADEARSFPTLGSSVSYALGDRAHLLPYVALPYTIYNVVQLPGQTPGFLGGAYDRFQVAGNPNSADFRIQALEPTIGRPSLDASLRKDLLHRLDTLPAGVAASQMRTYQERALELVSSDAVRRSFDLSSEDGKLRDRYGRHLLGQSLLLARRLVESGVNFVTVFDGQTNGQDANWDSHQTIFPRHRQLIPPADEGFSALIEDLESRGLLESTLVIAMGEFGRTPKINANAGRDHWPDCYSVVLSGGGLTGGAVYGASDKIGAYPDRDPVTPADLAATIFWRFAIDPTLEMHDPTNRPFRLADGQPLATLFA
ncbi:MAG TPA: DUF1501 domain-containing protein [Pirellulales bacterium]|nr:DUF1501 domain-containing protein [Pirellulales bacterium]